MQPEKKLFAQTTTQKKIVCLEKIFIPPSPSKKIMVRPLGKKTGSRSLLVPDHTQTKQTPVYSGEISSRSRQVRDWSAPVSCTHEIRCRDETSPGIEPLIRKRRSENINNAQTTNKDENEKRPRQRTDQTDTRVIKYKQRKVEKTQKAIPRGDVKHAKPKRN